MNRTDAPTTADEFMALPIEHRYAEIGVAYFAADDAVISLTDAAGGRWMLGRDDSGRWYRRPA